MLWIGRAALLGRVYPFSGKFPYFINPQKRLVIVIVWQEVWLYFVFREHFTCCVLWCVKNFIRFPHATIFVQQKVEFFLSRHVIAALMSGFHWTIIRKFQDSCCTNQPILPTHPKNIRQIIQQHYLFTTTDGCSTVLKQGL